MNLGRRRAVNETEIIKRRYLPLRSVNPRSNKAAAEEAQGEDGRRGRQRWYFPFPSSTSGMMVGAKDKKGKRFSPDDFLITRSRNFASPRPT